MFTTESVQGLFWPLPIDESILFVIFLLIAGWVVGAVVTEMKNHPLPGPLETLKD